MNPIYIGLLCSSAFCELPAIEIGGFLLHRLNFPYGSQPYPHDGWSRQLPVRSALRSVTGIHRRLRCVVRAVPVARAAKNMKMLRTLSTH